MKRLLGNARGMTLIEIMVVITILGLIATVVTVNVLDSLDEAKIKTAKTQMKGFEDAPIENFTLRNVDLKGVQGHAVLRNVRNMQLENVSINGHSLDNQMLNVGNETDTHSL